MSDKRTSRCRRWLRESGRRKGTLQRRPIETVWRAFDGAPTSGMAKIDNAYPLNGMIVGSMDIWQEFAPKCGERD